MIVMILGPTCAQTAHGSCKLKGEEASIASQTGVKANYLGLSSSPGHSKVSFTTPE